MKEAERHSALQAIDELLFWGERIQVELQTDPDAEVLRDLLDDMAAEERVEAVRHVVQGVLDRQELNGGVS